MAKLNVANRTAFLSDNLPILRGINSSSVDCVYLDPPFNRKKAFVDPIKNGDKSIQFDDTWRTPTSAEDLAALEADVREAGQASDLLRELLDAAKHDDDRHNQNYNYLAMMAARLVECRRVLKPTGSLFLHCDDTMSHWLKLLLDAIFGEKNFVNEILWCYSTASTPNIKQLPRCNNKILCYSKERERRKFRGDNIRVPYKGGGPHGGTEWLKEGETLEEWREKKAKKGKIPFDWWDDIAKPSNKEKSAVREAIVNGKKKRGYATQKPLSLLTRIIKSCTDPGDVVLDAFAGSCTTAKAAEDCDRGWIVIDKSPEACDIVKKRLSDLIAGKIECTLKAPKRTDVGEDPSESRAVYIITDSTAPDLVKVGISADPARRLESLRTGRPHREQLQLAFQHYTPRYRELEKHLHQKFSRNHEWVKASVEEVKQALAEFFK